MQWRYWLFIFATLCLSATHGTAAAVRFAIVGDYGADDAAELAVADLIKTNFQPEFVVTLGDNNYLGAANIDDAIGKYYHEYIGSYVGAYGAGASSNRFFPALGNHDWDELSGYSAHLNYFTLPGNERYYDVGRGPVHIFILNSDVNEPDGNTATSAQAIWFSNQIKNSTAPWRLVVCQDPPYSSTESLTWMRWPFEEWGASIVLSGDSHQYERIMLNGFPYVVNGAGGASLFGFGTPIEGSTVRYVDDHGAMLVTATETNIAYEFWSVGSGGLLIDRFTQTARPKLSIARGAGTIQLSWPSASGAGFVLETSEALAGGSWSNVTTSSTVSNGRNVVSLPTNSAMRYFRLRN